MFGIRGRTISYIDISPAHSHSARPSGCFCVKENAYPQKNATKTASLPYHHHCKILNKFTFSFIAAFAPQPIFAISVANIMALHANPSALPLISYGEPAKESAHNGSDSKI